MKEKLLSAIAISFAIILVTGFGTYLLIKEKSATIPPEFHSEGIYAASTEEPFVTSNQDPVVQPEQSNTTGVSQKIDLNSAGLSELDSLPGIGPTLAERIIVYRRHRPFKTIYDIKKVSGIGDKTFLELEELITVTP